MSKRKFKNNQANEIAGKYKSREIKFFGSFEEQEAYELQQMALLTSQEILEQMRQSINIAYGMHGYDPDNLPQVHTVRIISGSDEHI
ncbi:hypothetical protein BH11BAC7_BH11BAC7_24990 [soil metagenome]